MEKTTVESQKTGDRSSMSVWTTPILGESGIVAQVLAKLLQGKSEVPESVQMLHNGEMTDLQVFAKTAKAIDSYKFTDREFLLYVKTKICIARDIEEYKGLGRSTQLLQAAIEAKNSYLILDQTELRYRSAKQQEFYQYIESILGDYEDKAAFQAKVKAKIEELLPDVKTEEGKTALQEYQKELIRLSEYELGLKLLALFKAYQLADYSILQTISNMVMNIRERETIDYKVLVAMVISKYDVFEKLKKIIGVADKQSNPDTYARMLQFIALSYRHQNSYATFAELQRVMRKWSRPYHAMMGLRTEYCPSKYKQPRSFSEPIPGLDIYEKYKKALSDEKTGLVYVDFDN